MTHPQSQCLPDGAILFREGEPGDYAYYIEDGRIELVSLFDGGGLVLSTLGAGDVVGEMALLDNQVRTATAYVRGHAQVIRIHSSHVLDKLHRTDPLIALVLKAVLYRFRDMRERLHLIADKERIDLLRRRGGLQSPIAYDAESRLAGRDIKTEVRLKAAFDNQELELFAQPIVAMPDHRMLGAETLLRWRHPVNGLLGPASLIVSAERTGLIVDIGYWVMEQSCAALMTLDALLAARQVPNPVQFMSVNVSPRQFQEPDFVDRVRRILQQTGADPRRLKLEITESMILDHPLLTESRLLSLKALGMDIALDDFGTGYSSLSALLEYPIDSLKIDRSFVSRMGQERKARNIVKAILTLADDLGFEVVAEGVEHSDQAGLLMGLGCTTAQGYLYGPPLPLHQFADTACRAATAGRVC